MDHPAAKVRLLVLDVDGVMTDGGISIDDLGRETKRFHVRDGVGLWAWRTLGGETAVVTGRRGMALKHRLNELSITRVVQGSPRKADALRNLLEQLDLRPEETAVLGDDLPDLPLLEMAGYPMAVADAAPEILERATFVTARPGGHAAVREAVEHLLKARGAWGDAVALFSGTVDPA